jgi:hypothetical protein
MTTASSNGRTADECPNPAAREGRLQANGSRPAGSRHARAATRSLTEPSLWVRTLSLRARLKRFELPIFWFVGALQ